MRTRRSIALPSLSNCWISPILRWTLSGRRYKVGIRIQNALAGLRSCDVCIVCCLWSVDAESVVSHNAIEDRLYACLSFTFLLSVSQSCCASEFRTFVNVSVNVPLDAPLGTAKSTVTLAVSDPDVSVTDDGTTVHVEFGGPPLQVRLMVPGIQSLTIA